MNILSAFLTYLNFPKGPQRNTISKINLNPTGIFTLRGSLRVPWPIHNVKARASRNSRRRVWGLRPLHHSPARRTVPAVTALQPSPIDENLIRTDSHAYAQNRFNSYNTLYPPEIITLFRVYPRLIPRTSSKFAISEREPAAVPS